MSYDTPLDFGWHQSVADRLNLLQTGWTAKVYDKSPRAESCGIWLELCSGRFLASQ